MIYWIQEGTNVVGQGMVKIGISSNPLRRLAELQSGNPRKLYLVLIGMPEDLGNGFELEASEHRTFADLRVRGTEWFYPGEKLRLHMLSGCSGWHTCDPNTFAPAIDPADVAEDVRWWLQDG